VKIGGVYAQIAAVEAQRQQIAGVGLLEQILDEVRTLAAPPEPVLSECDAGRHTPDHAAVSEFPIERADAVEQGEATG
jgi:hypothetical protein